MNARSSRTVLSRQNLVPLTVFLLLSLVAFFGFAASGARPQQSGTASSARNERDFENTIPEHVPIKVKLKSEKSFKDLTNKGWARELELEVKNTGTKPIHYLYVILDMPDVLLEDGVPLSFRVSYGKSSLSEASPPLRPDETPIPPGESVTLKIQEKRWKAYEMIREEKERADPRRVRLELQILEYGDGTGFESIKGVPLLPQPKKSSLDKPPAKGSGSACQPSPEERVKGSTVSFLKIASFSEPASLLRVNFFLPEPSSPPAARSRDLCNCQNIPNCFYGVLTCPYQCPCDFHCEFLTHVATGSCSTPGGRCRMVALTHESCDTENNGVQTCSYDKVIAPCTIGDPTPTPTPTPTLTPTPTPTPTPHPCPPPCGPYGEPNPSCFCVQFPNGAGADWFCDPCFGKPRVDYCQHPATGCPTGFYNDGVTNCCQPYFAGLSCTTQGFNGGCLYPTVPGGSGLCCLAGDSQSCSALGWYWNFDEGYCQDSPWYCMQEPVNCGLSFMWSTESCRCEYVSPVLVDVLGDGFRMTDSAAGVYFDINHDGAAERVSWTAPGSDDAWLALDLNGNGAVDDGGELFGTFTPQPEPTAGAERNGFLALAAYDKAGRGGNSDGLIDSRDAVFPSLRLWQDGNHDGVSQPAELHTLPELDVVRIHLDYKESKRTDEYGNQFRYRAKADDAKGAKAGRWAWDVFLVRGQ